jgi:hypothetical protein
MRRKGKVLSFGLAKEAALLLNPTGLYIIYRNIDSLTINQEHSLSFLIPFLSLLSRIQF